jgi:hypothetical protein
MDGTLLAHCGAEKMTYDELALVQTPQGTDTPSGFGTSVFTRWSSPSTKRATRCSA